MKFRGTLFLCVAILCAACAPTTQYKIYRTHRDIRISKDPGSPFIVNLRTPTLSGPEQGEIDTAASYARDSRGQQFHLATAKIPGVEADPARSYFLTRELFLISPAGVRHTGWPNGDWQLHVELLSDRGRETYDADFNLSFLLWTPFSGPPN